MVAEAVMMTIMMVVDAAHQMKIMTITADVVHQTMTIMMAADVVMVAAEALLLWIVMRYAVSQAWADAHLMVAVAVMMMIMMAVAVAHQMVTITVVAAHQMMTITVAAALLGIMMMTMTDAAVAMVAAGALHQWMMMKYAA